MKVIKLDGRYRGFPKWKYAVEFSHKDRNHHGSREYNGYCRQFAEIYGPAVAYNPEWTVGKAFIENRWIYNEEWTSDYESRRIYYKNPAVISWISLQLEVDH